MYSLIIDKEKTAETKQNKEENYETLNGNWEVEVG